MINGHRSKNFFSLLSKLPKKFWFRESSHFWCQEEIRKGKRIKWEKFFFKEGAGFFSTSDKRPFFCDGAKKEVLLPSFLLFISPSHSPSEN